MAEKPKHKLLMAAHVHSSVHPAFCQSYAETFAVMAGLGVAFSGALFKDSDVSRGRNTAVQGMLDAGYTHIMFVDADMEWKPSDVLRLMSHDKEICVGAYRKKNPRDEYNFEFVPSDDNGVLCCGATGCMEVLRAGTGFMMIKREVFERMREAMPEIHHTERMKDGNWRDTAAWFSFEIRDTKAGREQFSEDYNFCERWRSMGGKIWMDPDIKLGHYGDYCWQGDIGAKLDAESAEAPEGWTA